MRRAARARRALLAVATATVAAMLTGCVPAGWFGGAAAAPTASSDGSVTDDFDGPAGTNPSGVWTIQTGGGGWGNRELQTYTDDAVFLDGEGHLVIEATIPQDGSAPTSGRLTTQGAFSFTYGTVTARIQIPDGKGLLPAFWLLGDSLPVLGWPAAGEIDVVETPSTTDTSVHTVHGPTSTGDRWSLSRSIDHLPPLSAGFHDYAIRKEQGALTFLIDDEVVFSVRRDEAPLTAVWVFDAPFHLLFSLAVGGNWPGAPDATTPQTARMLVDWVSYVPLPTPTPTPTAP